jgi:hypothetical protein
MASRSLRAARSGEAVYSADFFAWVTRAGSTGRGPRPSRAARRWGTRPRNVLSVGRGKAKASLL